MPAHGGGAQQGWVPMREAAGEALGEGQGPAQNGEQELGAVQCEGPFDMGAGGLAARGAGRALRGGRLGKAEGAGETAARGRIGPRRGRGGHADAHRRQHKLSREGEEIAAHEGAGPGKLPPHADGQASEPLRRRGRQQALQCKEYPGHRIPEFGKGAHLAHGRETSPARNPAGLAGADYFPGVRFQGFARAGGGESVAQERAGATGEGGN